MPDEKQPSRPEGSSIPLPKPPAWMTSIPAPDEDTPPPVPQPSPPPAAEPVAVKPAPEPPRPSEHPTVPPPIAPPPPKAVIAPPKPDSGFAEKDEAAEDFPIEDDEDVEEAAEVGVETDADLDAEGEPAPLSIDPAFAFIILLVVSGFGLSAVAADARFAAVCAGLGLVGMAAILSNEVPLPRPTMRDLLIGAGYGLLVGLPVLVIGRPQLARISGEIFRGFGDGMAFMVLAFAMPLAETLFFRGAFLAARGLLWAGAAGGLWAVFLLVPAMDVGAFPLVTIVIGSALVAINFLYAYLSTNFNLFAAWTCQIALNLALLWLPRLLP